MRGGIEKGDPLIWTESNIHLSSFKMFFYKKGKNKEKGSRLAFVVYSSF